MQRIAKTFLVIFDVNAEARNKERVVSLLRNRQNKHFYRPGIKSNKLS
jgi:hypothetical protein